MVSRSNLMSRAEAARMLRLSPRVWDRIAAKNGIRTFQVPGHSRKWFHRSDVETLLAAADIGAAVRVGVRA
jgi:hypothetical protein